MILALQHTTHTFSGIRGLGLAITKILLDDFQVVVVALSRTRTAELEQLMLSHVSTLLFIRCNVFVGTTKTHSLFPSELPYSVRTPPP